MLGLRCCSLAVKENKDTDPLKLKRPYPFIPYNIFDTFSCRCKGKDTRELYDSMQLSKTLQLLFFHKACYCHSPVIYRSLEIFKSLALLRH